MTTLQKACEIIFSNEGNYTSVNPNDNGALSIGKCQWHGNRAKDIIRLIVLDTHISANNLQLGWLVLWLKKEQSWENLVPNELEVQGLKHLLGSDKGMLIQDIQAVKDVRKYLLHVMNYDITDENTIIFLADIENQGGAGATKRIINNTINIFGKHFTLEQCMNVALNDAVFCRYQQRRLSVYHKLTGKKYDSSKAYEQLNTHFTYKVKDGDTLTSIAKKYKTTVKTIVKDNAIKNKNKINVGEILIIERK